MNKFWDKAVNAAMGALPTAAAPGNQYAKSYAAAMCLLVSADFRFDMDEFQQAARFMEMDRVLTDENLTARAASYFRGYIDSIQDVMDSRNLDFPTIQTELIMEVRKVTDEYHPALKGMLDQIWSASGPDERDIIKRINL